MRCKRLLLFLFFMFFCCFGTRSYAGLQPPGIQPPMFQSMIRAAGISSEIIESDPETGYPWSVYIADVKGSTVTIGFPSSGLKPGKPFLLEIDGMPATLTCTREGKLSLVDGDERIVAAGIFGTLECLFSTVLTMLADVFDSILSLDILGLIEAIVSGLLGVITCIVY